MRTLTGALGALALALLSCAWGKTIAAAPGSFSIYFTSNGQGEIKPCSCATRLGGLARRVSFIAGRRAAGEPLLVVDSGDVFFQPLSGRRGNSEAARKRARLIAAGMRTMGYAAVCPGEQDLELGPELYRELCTRAGATPVCANLNFGGKPVLEPYCLKKVGALTVAFIGVMGKQPALPAGFTASDPVESVKAAVAHVRKVADAVVVLSHQGYEADLGLAKRVGGIDYILGAHSGEQTETGVPYAGTSWHQVGTKGRYVGHITFTSDTNGKVRRLASETVAMSSRFKDDAAWEHVAALEP
jgi:2',3'-cyclic-nucleotide 2'-phosphodiesterase (5'-nucleotidase family)